MRKILFIIIFLIGNFNLYCAFEKGGILVPGAYPSALGGAFCAKADDICSICYNPAGLYQVNSLKLAGIYGSISNIKSFIVGTGISYNFNSYFASAISGVIYKKNVNYEEGSYNLTFSSNLLNDEEKEFSIGVNIKYLFAKNITYANAISADFGILLKLKNLLYSDNINFGLSIFDLQSSIRWNNGLEEKIPLLLKTGIAYIYKKYNFLFDIDIINDKNYINNYRTNLRFGVEKRFDFFSLRIGYAGFESILSSITFGLGININNFIIDYSFLNHTEELGSTHKIDLKYFFPENVRLDIKVFEGENKVLLKCFSDNKIDKYKIYIKDFNNIKIQEEKAVKGETLILVENMENNKEYVIDIVGIKDNKAIIRKEKIKVMPSKMQEEIKNIYNRARKLYSAKKYNEAFLEIEKAKKLNENADIILLYQKILNIIKIEKADK